MVESESERAPFNTDHYVMNPPIVTLLLYDAHGSNTGSGSLQSVVVFAVSMIKSRVFSNALHAGQRCVYTPCVSCIHVLPRPFKKMQLMSACPCIFPHACSTLCRTTSIPQPTYPTICSVHKDYDGTYNCMVPVADMLNHHPGPTLTLTLTLTVA